MNGYTYRELLIEKLRARLPALSWSLYNGYDAKILKLFMDIEKDIEVQLSYLSVE